MDVTYMKVKTLMPKDGTKIKVEVLQNLGQLEKDKWGNIKTAYDVKVDDKHLMRWEATQNQVDKMKEVGCNPFVIKRWDKGEKTGFNFLAPDDINALDQNCEPNLAGATIEKKVQVDKDEFQDKVSRGAAWNNAFAFCLQNYTGDIVEIDKFCEIVASQAEKIAPHQKAFVNKKESAPETPDGKGERYEDTTQTGALIDDLPF